MTRIIRDIALFENNLLAAIRNAGEAGVPLKDVLRDVAGRDPLGADYTVANGLRKRGLIGTVKNLPNGGLTAYAANGKAAVTTAEESTTKRRVRRHKPSTAAILVTLQYGRNESVTMSLDAAKQLYTQLAAMFGR